LELNQVIPKLTTKVKVEDFSIVEQLRNKERNSFFNMGETKYLQIENITYSLKTIKCLPILTGVG
jgi:hypothetical protein